MNGTLTYVVTYSLPGLLIKWNPTYSELGVSETWKITTTMAKEEEQQGGVNIWCCDIDVMES